MAIGLVKKEIKKITKNNVIISQRNMKRFFHRYVGFFAIAVLVFAISVKLYSIFTFPEISDWNFHQLQKINKNQTNFAFDVFGDNKNSVKTFENLIGKINDDNAAFAIDIGDLV